MHILTITNDFMESYLVHSRNICRGFDILKKSNKSWWSNSTVNNFLIGAQFSDVVDERPTAHEHNQTC